mgnify:CR=1 FL=1
MLQHGSKISYTRLIIKSSFLQSKRPLTRHYIIVANLSQDLAETLQAGYRYALSLTHHHYEAEDLVQEAWIRVWRKYGERSTRSLLFAAVRNRFIDGVRRGRVLSFSGIDDEEAVAGMSDGSGGGTRLTDAALDMDVLLAHLKPEEREALYLNVVEGYTAAEIGGTTNEPRGTVLSRIQRAREKLRSHSGLSRELGERTSDPRQRKEGT